MPSLKEFRSRITSVKSTQKITKAMQLVAAAKLKRTHDAADAARPYAERMAAVIANLAQGVNPAAAPKLLAGSGRDQTHLLVVMTADRGLCGAFNTNIVRKAREELRAREAAGKTVKLLCVGKKGRDALRRTHAAQIVGYIDLSHRKNVVADDALAIGQQLRAMFEEGAFDVATLIYSRYRSVISQIPTAQQLIPAKAPDGVAPPDLKGALYTYEPSEEAILEAILPAYVNSQIFRAQLENAAGEQGARMAAMDAATRNAGELIKKLTLQYNRQRQANITKELIEIISGAEAI